jgi:hypothetical protein
LGIQETYTNLSYNAPKCGNAPITLEGLSATDSNFGVWNYTFPVTGGLPLDGDGDCDGDIARLTAITEIFTIGIGS